MCGAVGCGGERVNKVTNHNLSAAPCRTIGVPVTRHAQPLFCFPSVLMYFLPPRDHDFCLFTSFLLKRKRLLVNASFILPSSVFASSFFPPSFYQRHNALKREQASYALRLFMIAPAAISAAAPPALTT